VTNLGKTLRSQSPLRDESTLVGIAARRIVTCDPALATSRDPLGVVEHGVVLYDKHSISWVGPRSAAEDKVPIVDHGDVVVTPGLVDAHTHAAWVGSRHDEYAMRMAGADYQAIAAAGGGILSSHEAIAEATEEEIAKTLEARLRRMADLGVTTCEVKSGYGLDADGERKQLRAITTVRAKRDVPRIVPTFLALHAMPPKANRDHYVLRATSLVQEFAQQKLALFVDAYIDKNAFTVDEARLVCEAARRAGLGIRLHVGQFADVGGAELAAELGAKSVDHMEHVGDAGIAALARAGTAATLLPIASFTLGQAPPPVAALRAAGVPLVVASDANPGTAPSESLPLAMALAVRMYGLTPAETLLGATRHAAASLGVFGSGTSRPRGAIVAGARADMVVWELPHENAIVQPWGSAMTRVVLRSGAVIGGHARVSAG
jgi:imidazolonepropionase